MTYYQAVAENGISYCQGANKLVQCGPELAGMKPADGLLFAEGIPATGVQALPRDQSVAFDPSTAR
jgi:hypothetical protein